MSEPTIEEEIDAIEREFRKQISGRFLGIDDDTAELFASLARAGAAAGACLVMNGLEETLTEIRMGYLQADVEGVLQQAEDDDPG